MRAKPDTESVLQATVGTFTFPHRATAVREKEELARLLADSRQRLQQTSGQLQAHASQTMAWGSVVLARLARESSGMPSRIAAGGGVEALVVGLTRSQRMDKSVVLDSMCTIMQATSGVVEPWRSVHLLWCSSLCVRDQSSIMLLPVRVLRCVSMCACLYA